MPAAALRGSGVGARRDLGLRAVLDRLSGHPTAGTWLLSTDADTTVPVDWVAAHLRHAADGVHAVAGLADLAATDHLADAALSCYRAIVEHGLHGATHHHVYGANLGVRADAYLAVGGFPPDGAGEDHGLWQRLAAGGYTLAQPVRHPRADERPAPRACRRRPRRAPARAAPRRSPRRPGDLGGRRGPRRCLTGPGPPPTVVG